MIIYDNYSLNWYLPTRYHLIISKIITQNGNYFILNANFSHKLYFETLCENHCETLPHNNMIILIINIIITNHKGLKCVYNLENYLYI